MKPRIRVLIVDDSAFARKTLRVVLSSQPDIEVVGVARDGLEALEKVAELKPDVVTLDLVMPHLDGLGFLRGLPRDARCGVVVVSISGADTEIALLALELGALELVRKPTALAADQLYDLHDELVAKVRAVALARRLAPLESPVVRAVAPNRAPTQTRLLVVGASTGGPNAIARLLASLPGDFPVPIVVALHIPAGYTRALAARLNEQSALAVEEAYEGLIVRPGMAALARGGEHALIRRTHEGIVVHVSHVPTNVFYFPCIDLLFESAVAELGGGLVGVVLTGMGDDGMRGAGLIRAAGGSVLTESESSCVIYGMPRSVVEAGFSNAAAPLDAMAELILSFLK